MCYTIRVGERLIPIYTRRKDKLHVALESRQRNTIVALGSFPHNVPRSVISAWIQKHEKQIGRSSGVEVWWAKN